MKRVQHEKSATWIQENMKRKQHRKKCNLKRMQHEKTATQKECNRNKVKKVQEKNGK